MADCHHAAVVCAQVVGAVEQVDGLGAADLRRVAAGARATVTVSVEVTNTGSESGSHTVALKIGGEVEEEKTVSLNPYEAEKVSFHVEPSQLGIFEVEVDGLSGSYTVTEKEEEPSGGVPGFPYESIILGIMAGVVILWMLQRRI